MLAVFKIIRYLTIHILWKSLLISKLPFQFVDPPQCSGIHNLAASFFFFYFRACKHYYTVEKRAGQDGKAESWDTQ